MIVPTYPDSVVLRFKYIQICFPFSRFLRLRNSAWDFLGFWYLAPFDHPCHLKSEVPPLGKILVPSTDCDVISCNGQVVKRSFKPHENEHELVKDTGEKGKTSCNFDLKLSIKSCSTTHLLSFNPKVLKAYPAKMQPPSLPAKLKKNEATKSEKSGEERKRKVKVKTAASNFAFCACPNLAS